MNAKSPKTPSDRSEGTKKKSSSLKRNLIEWGILIGVIVILYATGLHTPLIGTLQKGLLATGLIKPDIPESTVTAGYPDADPGFYFADESGRTQSLDLYRGKVIFLNVWATWCPPCIAEMPSIQALYDNVSDNDDIVFLLVSVDENFDIAQRFMENRELSMPIVHFRGKAPGTYESGVVPTTYVISKDGKLMMEKQGFAKYDTPEFEQFLMELAGI
ncbi:TlpA family protein disulfide reductase [Rhodohalobacter mucosus]|uniref:Thioredoxin n=1 Tax=Rhodohalobacter mucosus TaxID=2079485 RepID=A0A316TTL9_9BACT|nr:TlpA disulfide reductase family protein [Rhodohalobacter mucosus]PWN07933.1 thioredoxin [Rhodohalobacter mucosus]